MEVNLPLHSMAVLSRRVREVVRPLGWADRHGGELLRFVGRAAVFALGAIVFPLAPGPVRPFLFALLSYLYYGIAVTGVHEASHQAWVASRWGNQLWGLFFSVFWSGQSFAWWHHRHVQQHHAWTNMPERDEPVFVYPWLNKYVYFFVAPFLLPFWLAAHSIAFLHRKPVRLAVHLALAAADWLFHTWLFRPVCSWPWAFACAYGLRSLFAPVFLQVAVFNHVGLDNPVTRRPWLPHQTSTTRNLKSHWLLTGLGGNAFVDCHIEHHLFPGLSNGLLARIRPIVRAHLEREGIAYVEESYATCLRNCLRGYDALFRAEAEAARREKSDSTTAA